METINLYPYLIIIGSSILAAATWLLYKYRTQNQHSHELIRLNEQLGYDLPNFLRQCWPLIKRGGVSGMHWQLHWFGTMLSEGHGKREGTIIERDFDVQEISLKITLYLGNRGWEQLYFSKALAENFFLLVRMNIWIKVGTVQGAFDQTAKMAVFLQHDMKNILQIIKLTADQLENPVPGQEAKLINSLRMAIPAVRDRAEHMLKGLVSQPAAGHNSCLQLETYLQEAASMYALPISINGHATASVTDDTLQSIIDNIIGNYSQISKIDSNINLDLQIELENTRTMAIARFEDKNGSPFKWPERLFEPFWSEYGKGRGIGLYQARQKALAAGGALVVEANADKPLRFVLSLPADL
ncbi:MAG: hypothetical protein WD601_14050 [Pseudohongiellaceae bacterium]